MVKYRLEFQDITETSTTPGIIWKIDILENNFAGAITTLVAGGTPLVFSYDNNEDNVFDPIRETHCNISVYSDTDFFLQDLYSIELLQFQVNVYADNILQWWGYIEPQKYEEDYEPAPYLVNISCTDGLSALETEYKNGDNYFVGRRYESQIVLDCLSRIGHTEFIEFVNIYEDGFNKTVDDSVFDQVLVETYALRELSCIEVLTEILQKYNAYIRQKDGVFNIVRPKELIGATVYGRHFTAYDTKTSVTITPLQYINRVGYASNRLQVPGGVLMIEPPVQKVVINQDYGNRDSWLANYEFTKDTRNGYLLSGYTFDDWVNYGTPAVGLVAEEAMGEDSGLMIPYSAAPDNNYIYSQFGINSKISTTDEFALEFDWMFINRGLTFRDEIELKIIITDGTYNLKAHEHFNIEPAGTATWGNNTDYVSIAFGAELGTPAWKHSKFTFIGLPSDGPYTIKIFPLYNSLSTIFLGIKDIRFYTSSVNIIVMPLKYTSRMIEKLTKFLRPRRYAKFHPVTEIRKEFDPVMTRQYTAENAINGYVVTNEFSFKLGDVVDNDIDNIPEQFAGSLGRGSLTLLNRVDEVILTTDNGTGQAQIYNNGFSATAVWNTSLAQTATDFINNHNGDFTGVNVTSGGSEIIRFTHATAGVEFDGETRIINTEFDLDGYVSIMQPYLTETPTITPTATWSSRGGGEAKALLQFIADEVRDVYSRPKQLIQMPIMETAKAVQINTLGNFQDARDCFSGAMRVFVMNRGMFDVRNREWDIDLFEIGVGAAPSGEALSLTADSTLINADNTIYTTDNQ